MAARVRAFWPKATIQHVMLSPEMQYTELENRCALTRTVGSNPTPSASFQSLSAVNGGAKLVHPGGAKLGSGPIKGIPKAVLA